MMLAQREKLLKDYSDTCNVYAMSLNLSSAPEMLRAYWWLITALREVVPCS